MNLMIDLDAIASYAAGNDIVVVMQDTGKALIYDMAGNIIGEGVEIGFDAIKAAKVNAGVSPAKSNDIDAITPPANPKRTHNNSEGESGTVWDKIKPTQENRAGTQIPKSFNIKIDGVDYWVAPNATKHMYDYITREEINFEYNFCTPINSQSILTEFDAALEDAIKNNGVIVDEMIKGGDWEFMLSAPREEGLNYVVKHARYNPN